MNTWYWPGVAAVIALSVPAGAIAVRGEEPQHAMGQTLQRAMIWLPDRPVNEQVYAVFRRDFRLDEAPAAATLYLFADSRYILWINGAYVERGPCRFDPKSPRYDVLPVTRLLRPGANCLAVLVHHYTDGKAGPDGTGGSGQEFCGRIMRHPPGLTACLVMRGSQGREQRLVTDAAWRASTQTRFGPSPPSWTSIPDNMDARRDSGDWASVGFAAPGWEPAVPVDGGKWGPLRPRDIPLLDEKDIGPLVLLECDPLPAGVKTPCPLADCLPLTLAAGGRLVIDAGQMSQAYAVLDFEAGAGVEVSVEHLGSAGRGAPCGYVTRQGRQTFMLGDTWGVRRLEVRFKTGPITLYGVRIVKRGYAFERLGRFTCDDPLLERIWQVCVKGVEVCSEDAYVDCASRERTEWMADGYVVAYRVTRVALAGPGTVPIFAERPGTVPTFAEQPGTVPIFAERKWDCPPPGQNYRYSDPRLLRSLLRHIAQSQQPDGRLKAHHPSDRWDIHGYIEDYSCLWVQALREYYDHTGDQELVRELWPALTGQLKWFLDRRTPRGLVEGREFVYFGNPLAYKTCEGATLNAFLYRALGDAAFLAELLGKLPERDEYHRAADILGRAINRELWDPAAGRYFGSLQGDEKTPPTVHAALMCLYFDVVPDERRPGVLAWLLENYAKEDLAPYTHFFLFHEMYRADTDRADREALDLMRRRWKTMAENELGTCAEGFGGGEWCHEAGAAPAYFLSAYVLGVRTDGPVSAKRLLIEPRLADLKRAEGVVVTEHGPVPVAWKRSDDGSRLDFQFEVPPGVTATLSLPPIAAQPAITLDGRSLAADQMLIRGRHVQVQVAAGRHSGYIGAAGP